MVRDDAPSGKEQLSLELGSEGEESSSSEGEVVAGSCLMPRGCGPSIDAVDDTSSNTTYQSASNPGMRDHVETGIDRRHVGQDIYACGGEIGDSDSSHELSFPKLEDESRADAMRLSRVDSGRPSNKRALRSRDSKKARRKQRVATRYEQKAVDQAEAIVSSSESVLDDRKNDVGELTRRRKEIVNPPLVRESQWEVVSIEEVARMGKKRNGETRFRVIWGTGEETWEPPRNLVEGASELLKDFILRLKTKFYQVFRKGELEQLKAQLWEAPTQDRKARREICARLRERDIVFKALQKVKEVGGVKVPATLHKARKHSRWKDFREAMEKEFNSFGAKKAWRLVKRPKDAHVVSVRWVFDIKGKEDKIERFKARLVCRGFTQKEGVDYNPQELFAPTMRSKTLRMLMLLAARDGADVRQFDISVAFLHALLDETVYVDQPEEFVVKGKEDWVYILDRAVYGLKQSPRAFSKHFAKCVEQIGFTPSDADECLFIRKWDDGSYCYLVFHVDDIITVSSNEERRKQVFRGLQLCDLDIRDEGKADMFLGLKFVYHDDYIGLSQTHYITQMAERFECTGGGAIHTPGDSRKCMSLSKEDLPSTPGEERAASLLPFPALCGALLYACKTRPEVAYAVSELSVYMSKWGSRTYEQGLRVLRYLYQTRDKCLKFTRGDDRDVDIVAYADSNYGDSRDSGMGDKWRSQGGHAIFVAGQLVA
jgi:hypothetical protein